MVGNTTTRNAGRKLLRVHMRFEAGSSGRRRPLASVIEVQQSEKERTAR